MIIGLTGKSCSGKNIASLHMEAIGWKVLDLDVIGHDLLDEKKEEIEKTFGTSQRREISKIVFNNPEKRKILEDILYPDITKAVLEAEKTNPIVVANGALLYRANIDSLCKFIIYIDASYEVRLQRAIMRDGITEKDFELRDKAQYDVHYNDVKYRAPVVVVDSENGCSDEIEQLCSKISSGQDIL